MHTKKCYSFYSQVWHNYLKNNDGFTDDQEKISASAGKTLILITSAKTIIFNQHKKTVSRYRIKKDGNNNENNTHKSLQV